MANSTVRTLFDSSDGGHKIVFREGDPHFPDFSLPPEILDTIARLETSRRQSALRWKDFIVG